MFGKDKQPLSSGKVSSGKIDTVIGNGSNFNGNLNVEGTLRIDGTVEGEIKINGDIVVGKSGSVRANIKGHNVTVAGEVVGDINLDGKLEMGNTGTVIGNIEVSKLVINEGAQFKGMSVMRSTDPTAEKLTVLMKDERSQETQTNQVQASNAQ